MAITVIAIATVTIIATVDCYHYCDKRDLAVWIVIQKLGTAPANLKLDNKQNIVRYSPALCKGGLYIGFYRGV